MSLWECFFSFFKVDRKKGFNNHAYLVDTAFVSNVQLSRVESNLAMRSCDFSSLITRGRVPFSSKPGGGPTGDATSSFSEDLDRKLSETPALE